VESILSFTSFVDTLDEAMHACMEASVTIVFEEQQSEAVWIREPFRAGVAKSDDGVRAWIGLDGLVARAFDEPMTYESARRLGAEFAAILVGPEAALGGDG
jgi:hypothetical protein